MQYKSRSVKPVHLLVLSVIALLLSSCAAMNAFQTPDGLEPGEVVVRPGSMLSTSAPIFAQQRPGREPIPLGSGLNFGLRAGILPAVDVGAQVVGVGAYGADVKVQLLYDSWPVAVNAGFGRGKVEEVGWGGSSDTITRTHFGGVFVGHASVYSAFKLTDYRYRKNESTDSSDHIDTYEYKRLIPGFTLGRSDDPDLRMRSVMEVNVYFLPRAALTFGMGVQIRLGG